MFCTFLGLQKSEGPLGWHWRRLELLLHNRESGIMLRSDGAAGATGFFFQKHQRKVFTGKSKRAAKAAKEATTLGRKKKKQRSSIQQQFMCVSLDGRATTYSSS